VDYRRAFARGRIDNAEQDAILIGAGTAIADDPQPAGCRAWKRDRHSDRVDGAPRERVAVRGGARAPDDRDARPVPDQNSLATWLRPASKLSICPRTRPAMSITAMLPGSARKA
jgi:hypothetical protein